MSQYRTARRRVTLSVGESVRIVRELQELSQNQLAALGIPQTTISAIENDRVISGGGARQGPGAGFEVSPGGAGVSGLGSDGDLGGLIQFVRQIKKARYFRSEPF